VPLSKFCFFARTRTCGFSGPIPKMSGWWVYICEKNGLLYTGITTNLDRRLMQHGNPKLLHKEGPVTRDQAVNREKQITRMEARKEAGTLPGRARKLEVSLPSFAAFRTSSRSEGSPARGAILSDFSNRQNASENLPPSLNVSKKAASFSFHMEFPTYSSWP
jgi:predicted GIY-YIG superfamily endonuclease